jgi:parallel beta-helix repeat protein
MSVFLLALLLQDPLEIDRDTTLDPSRTYGPIVVKASGVTVDGRGARLVGKDRKGIGISARGVSNVTLRNVKAEGFDTGLVVEDGEGWTIEGCDFSDNFHDPEFGWGEQGRRGGMVLTRVRRSVIRKNKANRVWDACVLVESNDNRIEENDFSRCSNTCLKLWTACRNEVRGNNLSYGIRIKPGEVHARDSTGVLIESGSNDNRFLDNDVTHGGDGIFIRVLNGWVSVRNYFEGNDCSYANNNGFEAWSPYNTYVRNKANRCSYGFWLGASDKSVLIGNEASHNGDPNGNRNSPHLPRAGHAGIVFMFGPSSHTIVRDNVCVGNNGAGIALIGDEKGAWKAFHWIVEGNRLERNRWGVFVQRADWIDMAANRFEGNSEGDVHDAGGVTNLFRHADNPKIERPPKAVLKGPALLHAGQEVEFDASGSSDPDGNALTCRWDLGDGTVSTEARVRHAYRRPGFYRLGLTVNNGMRSDLAYADVYVVDPGEELGRAADWTWQDDRSKVAFSDDDVRIAGETSVRARIDPYSGGRTNLVYPRTKDLGRPVPARVSFWIRFINPNRAGFQDANPIVTLHETESTFVRLVPRGNLLGQLAYIEGREGWNLFDVPVSGDARWRREGGPIDRVQWISIGVDSWDHGPMTIWIDGLQFRVDPGVSVESLLAEMGDLDRLARPPAPGVTVRQFSSYDRASKSPNENWFANGDAGHYLRVEKGWHVMAEIEGPGAVVRIWSANPAGTLRVWIDGRVAIEEDFARLLRGDVPPFGPPFAGVRGRGYNLYFPIPFAKSLKVECDRGGQYYHVNVRSVPPGTRVEPFDRARLPAPALAADPARGEELKFEAAGLRGRRALVELSGARRIVRLRMSFEGEDLEQALRAAVLRMTFDGEETVWCPLGDFFGTAPGLRPFETIPLSVKGRTAECRFPMPFDRSAKIEVDSPLPITIRGSVEHEPGEPGLLRFWARWRGSNSVATRPMFDWSVLRGNGRGRYVGTMLSVRNPVRHWWGEGDEKIFVDGEAFPSTFGTGTEDYFGYAWCDTALFTHPYHAQSRCDGPANRGHSSVNRFHILDDIPFQSSIRFDLEVWHSADCEIGYSTVAYFYAAPGFEHDFKAAPIEERRVVALPELRGVPGAIEGERLRVLHKTAGEAGPQDMAGFGAGWSLDEHLWWRGARPGDALRLRFESPSEGKHSLFLALTAAPDYGIVKISINGAVAAEAVDLFAPKVSKREEIGLKGVELAKGANELTVEIVGSNPKANPKNHMFGLDYLRVEQDEIVIDRDNLRIAQSVRIKPGVYRVRDEDGSGVLHVEADDVVIDFQGATLWGADERTGQDEYKGIGILVKGRKNVTIRNARIHGYLYNIRAEETEGLRVIDCDVSRARAQRIEKEGRPIPIWLHLRSLQAWRSYGAGIWIEKSRRALVQGTIGRETQNGVLLVDSEECEILQNDFSFNSGWGIGLWASSRNRVMYNLADFVNRPWGGGWGGDSAALVVVNSSHRNWIVGDSLTHGGDGLFLTNRADAGDPADGPCNDNLIAYNDGSYSTANAFEATFSDRNHFVGNLANHSGYGFWCGYSNESLFTGNEMRGNANGGIAIEHGRGHWIEGNLFEKNGAALQIWRQPERRKHPSKDYAIRNNRILGNKAGVEVRQTEGVRIENNEFRDNAVALSVGDGVTGATARRNNFVGKEFVRGRDLVDLRENWWEGGPAGPDALGEAAGPLVAYRESGGPAGWEWLKPSAWSPTNFARADVYPARATGWGEVRFHLPGKGRAFRVERVPDGIEIEPREGATPAALRVRLARPGQVLPFRFDVVFGDGTRATASGVLTSARWKLEWRQYSPDLKPENAEGWAKLFASKPAKATESDRIDFIWGGGGPEGLRGDHFALRATAEIEFPAGTYTFRTISDDGVRVKVDGKVVLENWTWHPPKEDEARVRIAAGRRTVTVEYFEITGHAQLQLWWSLDPEEH